MTKSKNMTKTQCFIIEQRIMNIDINQKYSSSTNLLTSWFSKSSQSKYPQFRLVSPDRWFIKQGYLTKVSRTKNINYLFVLFNDLLIYLSDAVNKNLILHLRIGLDDSSFYIKEVGEDSPYKSYNAFEIHSIEKSFICYASTCEETKEWFNAIKKCQEEIIDKGYKGFVRLIQK